MLDIPHINDFEDPETLQTAIDHSIQVRSSKSFQYLADHYESTGLEVRVHILTVASLLDTLLKACESDSDSQETTHFNTAFQNVTAILKLLLDKRVVLKYSHTHDSRRDILEKCLLKFTHSQLSAENSTHFMTTHKESSKVKSKHMHKDFEPDEHELNRNMNASVQSVSFNSRPKKAKTTTNKPSRITRTLKGARVNKYARVGAKPGSSNGSAIRSEASLGGDSVRIRKIKSFLFEKGDLHAQRFRSPHIFNLNYKTELKILQSQDLVEIGLVVCMFTSDQTKTLVQSLDLKSYPSKHLVGLYKLLVLYEEKETFDFIFKQEYCRKEKAKVITQCFSYSLMINNPVLAMNIHNVYISETINEILENEETTSLELIDPILFYLNVFCEYDGSSKYSKRMDNFECYLYLLEQMINYFTFQQGKRFIETCHNLLKVGNNPSQISKKSTPDQARPSSSWSRANSVPLDQVVQDEILDNYRGNFILKQYKIIIIINN